MYHRIIIYIVCLLILSFSAQTVNGQGTTGTISGTVSDPQGAVIPGAWVTAINQSVGLERKVGTNRRGYYRIAGLPPGLYKVVIENQGFKTETISDVSISVTQDLAVNVALSVEGTTASMIVNTSVPSVETTSGLLSGIVDERKLRDLPLNGRDIAQLVLLQPGVIRSRASVQTSNTGNGLRFSVGGARPSQNYFQLDGTPINDALNNTPGSATPFGTLFGVETIREFRVLTNNFSSEFGRAAGAVFVAVTKSGTNEYHGSLFEFIRNDNLDARNFFDKVESGGKPEFRRNQFGGTIGGPIIKDKTFFFGSYEGLREYKGITTISTVPSNELRAAIAVGTRTIDSRSIPLLNLYPLANSAASSTNPDVATYSAITPRTAQDDFFTVKIDQKLGSNDNMFVRYLLDDSEQVLPRFFPQYTNQGFNRKQVITIEERKIIGASIVNEIRISFNRSTPAELVPTSPTTFELIQGRGLGEVNITGLSPIGTDRTNPKLFFQNQFQVGDNVFITRGRNNYKTGFSYDRFQFNGRAESRTRGRLRFRSINDLIAFKVRDFEGSAISSDFVRGYRQSLFGGFFQGDFKISTRLTLNLGARYDFATSPNEVNGKIANLRDINDANVTVGDKFYTAPKNNIAPRIGFAYDVFGNGKTALRGGFGIYHEPVLFNSYRSPGYGSLPFISTAILPAASVTSLPLLTTAFTSGARATESINYDLKPIYTMQYNLNIQRDLIGGTILTVAYVGSRGVNLLGMGDINTAVGVLQPDGRTFYPAGSTRRNPNFTVVRSIIQGFNSWYNGGTVGVAKRFSRGFQFQANYTYSKSIDERSGNSGRQEFSNGQARTLDPYNRKLDKALSNFDVRHNFTANFTYDLPYGSSNGFFSKIIKDWQINSIITLASGIPFTPIIDADPDQDATDENTARPDLVPGITLIPVNGKTSDQWFNPTAFAPPTIGYRGTAGRNIINGPNFKTIDLSLVRNIRLNEKKSLQFRAEAFNLFNRANFDLPANSDDGALVYTFSGGMFSNPGNVGRIFQTVGESRDLQMSLKFIF